MARRKEICWCCPPENSEPQAVDGHHVVPVEYGGPESGKKVNICPSCHDLIHSTAEHYYSTGEAPENLTPKQTILVKYIVRAKQEHVSSGKYKADTARNQLAIRVTNAELAAIHARKKEKGFKSLERYLKDLIFEDIKSGRQRSRAT